MIFSEGVDIMATKSMLKNVDIRDKKLGKSLILALEHAQSKDSKHVTMSRSYSDVRGDKIKTILGVK